MNSDRNAFFWSIPAGTWFSVRIRVSLFFLLVAAALCHRWESVGLGLGFSIALLLSALLHEFGHVLACRMTGGDAREILLTPLGGLAECHPAPSRNSRLWTVLGGPLVNVGLCLITLTSVIGSPLSQDCFSLTTFPAILRNELSVAEAAPLLIFKANWLLFLINLLPVPPLDGGRFVRFLMDDRIDPLVADAMHSRIGAVTGVLLLGAGLVLDNTWSMALGAIVLTLNLMDTFDTEFEDDEEESFLGYDFSEGFTSFERSAPRDEAEFEPDQQEPGLLDRWRSQREDERRRRIEEEEQAMGERLDVLLEKLHTLGDGGLSAAEKRQLEEISTRIRNRGRSGSS